MQELHYCHLCMHKGTDVIKIVDCYGESYLCNDADRCLTRYEAIEDFKRELFAQLNSGNE